MRILPLLTLAAVAALPLAAGQPGSDTKGKYYYKKNCKSCHVEGGQGPVLTPLSHTQAQWKRIFEAGKHGKEGVPFAPKFVTPEQLQDIKAFLVNHASDSPQPETCGG
jgi:mono/diheme cytochrome c family protein